VTPEAAFFVTPFEYTLDVSVAFSVLRIHPCLDRVPQTVARASQYIMVTDDIDLLADLIK
jgi:hypothetical protein